MTRLAVHHRQPWAGYLLGFALGGFFDGILLHQILQWHHLLLAIQTGPFRQMRTQLLADGLFHALMYVIALAGLYSLWWSRERTPRLSSKELIGDALTGFGVWHVLDSVLSHWILGIHRIKMDSPNPLLWDLIWFVVFGLAPLVFGILLRRRATHGDVHGGRSTATAAILVVAAMTTGTVAALPPKDARQVAVVVRPSDVNRLLDGLPSVGGGILWSDTSAALWIFTIAEGARPEQLYEHGAIYVSRSPAALGCLAWSRAALL